MELQRFLRGLLTVSAVVALEYSAAAQSQYATIDLGLASYGSFVGLALNDRGQVVGTSWPATTFAPFYSTAHAVLWDSGVKIALGTLDGCFSIPNAINSRGQVVGFFGDAGWCKEGGGWQHAFLWEKGVMTDLGTFGGSSGMALDINDRGQILAANFLWDNGAVTELRGISAHSINDRGQVVGQCPSYTGGGLHACIWENGATTDLGTLSGKFTWSDGIAINNRGEVAGVAINLEAHEFGDMLRAVVWKDGVITDLGAPGGSIACGINDKGQVVGRNGAVDTPSFLWQNGVLTHFPGYSFRAINNRGDVLSEGLLLVKRKPDVDGDGKVTCSDLAIVRAAFGKRRGESGFDIRADVNGDALVDIRDLAFVAWQLTPVARCP